MDAAKTLVVASADENSWGRAWLVPSTSELSIQALSQHIAAAAGTAPASVQAMTREQLAGLAAADTMVAEVAEMLYMLERSAVLDSAETQRILAVTATPFDDVLAEIVLSSTTESPNGARH